MIYRIRYALHLRRRVPDMGLIEALRYPAPNPEDRDDPIEDAEEEIYYMGDE